LEKALKLYDSRLAYCVGSHCGSCVGENIRHNDIKVSEVKDQKVIIDCKSKRSISKPSSIDVIPELGP